MSMMCDELPMIQYTVHILLEESGNSITMSENVHVTPRTCSFCLDVLATCTVCFCFYLTLLWL